MWKTIFVPHSARSCASRPRPRQPRWLWRSVVVLGFRLTFQLRIMFRLMFQLRIMVKRFRHAGVGLTRFGDGDRELSPRAWLGSIAFPQGLRNSGAGRWVGVVGAFWLCRE